MNRVHARIAFTSLILGLALFLAWSVLSWGGGLASVAAQQNDLPFEERKPIAEPRPNITVMTGQGFGDRPGDAMMALAPDGRVLYYEDEHDEYQDVDPDPPGSETVLVVASDYLSPRECSSEFECVRDRVLRVNLTTGDREEIYRFTAPSRINEKMHDVDRIDEDTLLIAGITYDRLYTVDIPTGLVTWQWEMQSEYDFDSGGDHPSDWTHMNDVEALPDGRIMASPRNHDQVIFIDPDEGLQQAWTLGADDDTDVLFEQHQPDYIPSDRGGPAVLVADSQNHRIVEYQRRDGEWEQTWEWSDRRMQWPRDADRLPNGHTLIEDSNGGRILEVNQDGDIVWQLELKSTYDVERLGTGDESVGGQSAVSLGLTSKTVQPDARMDSRSVATLAANAVRGLVPPKLESAILFVSPDWMGVWQWVALVLIIGVLAIWASVEVYWWSDRIIVRSPIKFT